MISLLQKTEKEQLQIHKYFFLLQPHTLPYQGKPQRLSFKNLHFYSSVFLELSQKLKITLHHEKEKRAAEFRANFTANQTGWKCVTIDILI